MVYNIATSFSMLYCHIHHPKFIQTKIALNLKPWPFKSSFTWVQNSYFHSCKVYSETIRKDIQLVDPCVAVASIMAYPYWTCDSKVSDQVAWFTFSERQPNTFGEQDTRKSCITRSSDRRKEIQTRSLIEELDLRSACNYSHPSPGMYVNLQAKRIQCKMVIFISLLREHYP